MDLMDNFMSIFTNKDKQRIVLVLERLALLEDKAHARYVETRLLYRTDDSPEVREMFSLYRQSAYIYNNISELLNGS